MNRVCLCAAYSGDNVANSLCSRDFCCFGLCKAKTLAKLSDVHLAPDFAGCQRLLATNGGLQISGDTMNATPGTYAPADLDSQLIAACLAFDALERCVDAFNDPADPAYIENDDVRDRAIAPIEAEQAPLIERICALRAVTPHGRQARARSFLLWFKAIDPVVDAVAPGRSWAERLVAAVLRDVSEES